MSTQFSTGPTRNVQAGDTPDLNDGMLSRGVAAESITRGIASFVKAGFVTIAAVADAIAGYAPFVPTASVDNSGGAAGDEVVSGVSADQRVALDILIGSADLNPDDFVKISATPGLVERWVPAVDDQRAKYARYLGIEAALLDRNTATPFDETLTPGIIPDQSLVPVSGDNTAWFQLLESQGGVEV
jgi:hypothetical protein